MKYGLSDSVIEKILNVLRSHPNIQEAIIFGSRAIGNYREGSDIDITLKGNISFDNLLRIENEIEDEMLPYKFDVSLFEKLENKKLLEHINNIGKVFYKKAN